MVRFEFFELVEFSLGSTISMAIIAGWSTVSSVDSFVAFKDFFGFLAAKICGAEQATRNNYNTTKKIINEWMNNINRNSLNDICKTYLDVIKWLMDFEILFKYLIYKHYDYQLV